METMGAILGRWLRGYYPLLFAGFSVLSLYQANIDDVPPVHVARPLLVALLVAGLVTWLLRKAAPTPERGSLMAAGTLLVGLSYGQLFDAIRNVEVAGLSLGHHRYLIAATLLLWLGWMVWVGWRLRQVSLAARVLQTIAIVVVILPLVGLGLRGVREAAWRLAPGASGIGAEDQGGLGQSESEPDIYYLILDGYGRSDILGQYYQLDNSDFTNWLESRGFYVADSATSNYNQTVLSLASSLNMTYLDEFAQSVAGGVTGRSQLAERLKHSQVRAYLEERGYQVIAFETGYSQTEIRDAGSYWAPERAGGASAFLGGRVTSFESLFLNATAFRAALDLDLLRRKLAALDPGQSLYEAHRVQVRYTFDSLGRAAAQPGPTFVFAHVIAPHPPFVFDATGGPKSVKGTFSLADADAFGGGTEAYIQGYRDQVVYVDSLAEAAIEQILARSDRPPVILVQGDHGPGAHMVWDSPEKSLVEERLRILSAYYFPDRAYDQLYPAISPVNSFRVVLDHFFGADLPMLPDRNYFATWDRPFDFYDVTARVVK
jgi:hypothetical protein